MQTLILADFWSVLGAIAMVAISVILIGLILLQKNRGSGLSGAFGGVGGHSAFGTKTGDVLTWVTVGLTTMFLLLAVLLNYAFDKTPKKAATAAAAQTSGEQTTEPAATGTEQPAAQGEPSTAQPAQPAAAEAAPAAAADPGAAVPEAAVPPPSEPPAPPPSEPVAEPVSPPPAGE